MQAEGGIGLDVPVGVATPHSGKILKGFKAREQVTLVPGGAASVTIFRCEGCRSLCTDYSIWLFGKCWRCGGHKLSGGTPGFFETQALIRKWDIVFFNYLFYRQHKEWGRGRTLGQAFREALKRLPQTVCYQVVAPAAHLLKKGDA